MMMKQFTAAGLTALLMLSAMAPAYATSDAETAAKEMERARQEVEKAREELRKATLELARSMAKAEKDNPRAQYFEHMTNPKRAMLGIIIDDEADKENRGVRILAITPGSGAEKAKLKAGDLILALNGQSLAAQAKQSPHRKMRDVMGGLEAGAEIKVEYERDGKRATATVTTTQPDPDFALSIMPPLPPRALLDMDELDLEQYLPGKMFHFRGPAIRGLELCKLDDDLAHYFKTKDGVLVVKAPKNGALNLKSGDVIQKIDGVAVSEPVTVLDKLRSRGDEQAVKIEVLRQNRKVTLNGKIPMADGGRHGIERRKRVEVIIEDDDEDEDEGT